MREPEHADAVVLGGGPAGLGAALALAREGADVLLLEGGPRVGGLCRTRWVEGHGLDLGGHIPFVRDEGRREWLEDLLGDDLVWVPRPVACVREGRIVPGRYLDQRDPDVPAGERGVGDRANAAGALDAVLGPGLVDLVARPYLEKVDGLPLERILADRPIRLMREQAAPEGFWFPRLGIGQLMDAMADAVREAGGRVEVGTPAAAIGITDGRADAVLAGDGARRIAADAVLASLPPALVAHLARPRAPREARRRLPTRAVVIVAMEVAADRVGEEAWVQVDAAAAPFSRAYEPLNWSRALAPPGRTALGLECYCAPTDDDPVWGAGDAELGEACARALAELGWIDDPGLARVIDVVRLPNAYPLPDAERAADLAAAPEWLAGVDGLELVRGADVLAAVAAGEAAAGRVAGARRG
jgi:protoporphyrinogen oxidase